MVKYLSDNRSDPRFQTILSKPQPLQAEVPAEMYPVDEVDMSAAFNMLQTGAGAYYQHQGQELQRENMEISYSTYQANRAEQKTKQAAAEKEKGLKNTMLNDYAIAVSRKVLDPYTQGQLTPTAAERAVRDLREEYIRNTGGVLNASDLTKIEKDSGVTFTKDLYNADLQRMNEAYKQEQQDYREYVNHAYDLTHPGDTKAIPFQEKAKYVNEVDATKENVRFNVQSDFNTATSSNDPNMTPGSYMSSGTSSSLGKITRDYLDVRMREGLNRPTYYGSEELLQIKQDAVREIANMPVEVNGQRTNLGSLYRTDILAGIVENAWLRSGIDQPYTQEQAALKSSVEELENLNKFYTQKYIEPQKIRNTMADLDSEAKLRFGIGDFAKYVMDEKFTSALTEWGALNPPLQKKIIDTINNISEADSLTGNLGAIQEGEGWRKAGEKLMVVDTSAGLAIKTAAIDRGRNILNGTGIYTNLPATRWDYTSAFTAMQDPKNTVLNGNEADPNSPSTIQKEDNTKISRELFLNLRTNEDMWNKFSEEDKAKLSRWFIDDTNALTATYLKRLQKGGFADNIVYDPSKKKFMPVNVTEQQLKENSASSDLWPSIDNLNKLIHSGVEEYDNYLLDSLLNKEGVAIREITKEDKVLQTPSTIKLARALRGENWKQAATQVVPSLWEGAKTVGETVIDVSTALTENVTVPVGEKVKEVASDVVEAVTDIVMAPDSNEAITDKFEGGVKSVTDKIADAFLKNTEYSEEEKKQMKDNFYNNYVKKVMEGISKGYDWLTSPDTFMGNVGAGIAGIRMGVDKTDEAVEKDLVEPFQNMVKNIKAYSENFGREYTTIPPYNLGIIARVVNGDETVTPQEAKAALIAYNQSSFGDKRKIDADFHIGMLDQNIESQLKEAAKDKSKSLFSKIGEVIVPSAAAAELPRDPFYETILSDEEVKEPKKKKEKKKKQERKDPFAEGMIGPEDEQ